MGQLPTSPSAHLSAQNLSRVVATNVKTYTHVPGLPLLPGQQRNPGGPTCLCSSLSAVSTEAYAVRMYSQGCLKVQNDEERTGFWLDFRRFEKILGPPTLYSEPVTRPLAFHPVIQ